MKEPYGKGEATSFRPRVLPVTPRGAIAKRRQRNWRAGGLSSENMQPSADPFLTAGRQYCQLRYSRAAGGLGVVEDFRHARKQCAREPGDLQSVCASRPVREGERTTSLACTFWRGRTAP